MRWFYSSALVLAMTIGLTPVSHATDVEVLQRQVDELGKRVAELEQRIGIMDTPAVQKAIKEVSGPQNPGDSKDTSNWEFLKVGYNYDEVRELLGEPIAIKKGGMEFWFYSDRKLEGPFVKFLFRKVNDWRGPTGQ